MAALSFVLPARWADAPVRIALIGAGGTGSQFADQLASLQTTLMALGHPGFEVEVHDGDTVAPSNIGRQRFTAADVGLAKAHVLVHRINLFYGLAWQARAMDVDPTCLPRADLIVTCVDRALFRAALGKAGKARFGRTLWMDFGNGADSGQVILGDLGTAPVGQLRLPNVFDLFPELADMAAADAEQPSCSTEESIRRQSWPVNRTAALLGAELLWALFREGRVGHHGAFFSLSPMTVRPLSIDPEAWAFMASAPSAEKSELASQPRQ